MRDIYGIGQQDVTSAVMRQFKSHYCFSLRLSEEQQDTGDDLCPFVEQITETFTVFRTFCLSIEQLKR